jgi:hypothetical protein
MATDLRRGDRVEWNFRGHVVAGKVVRRLTSPVEVGGRRFPASPNDPRYLVRTEKTGKEAVHRAGALRKIG